MRTKAWGRRTKYHAAYAGNKSDLDFLIQLPKMDHGIFVGRKLKNENKPDSNFSCAYLHSWYDRVSFLHFYFETYFLHHVRISV